MLLQLRAKYTFHKKKKNIWAIASGIGNLGLFINVRTSVVLFKYQNGSQFIFNLSSLFTHAKRGRKRRFVEMPSYALDTVVPAHGIFR